MANARDIAKERCQQNLYVTGKKHWEKDVSANKNVERTKMPSSRDRARERERDQKKELSGKRTVEEKQRCLACTKSVYWNTACKMSRPHSQGPRGKQPPTGNSRQPPRAGPSCRDTFTCSNIEFFSQAAFCGAKWSKKIWLQRDKFDILGYPRNAVGRGYRADVYLRNAFWQRRSVE